MLCDTRKWNKEIDEGGDWSWRGRSRCEIPLLTVISVRGKLPKRERREPETRTGKKEEVVHGDDGSHA